MTGSDEASDCIDCVVGQYIDVTGSDELSDCIVCIAGTYIDVTGSDELSDCIVCVVGKYIDVTGSDELADCIDCVVGKYIDETGSDELADCIACIAGRYIDVAGSDEAADCIECTAGKISQGGATKCIACGTPKCRMLRSDASQHDCDALQFVANPDQTICVECAPGTEPSLDRTACMDCPLGTASEDGIDCLACNDTNVNHNQSSVTNAGRSACVPCGPGDEANARGSECIECRAKTYAPCSGSGCQACKSPLVVTPDRTACLVGYKCDPATACSSDVCRTALDCEHCLPGAVSAGGELQEPCQNCSDNGPGLHLA